VIKKRGKYESLATGAPAHPQRDNLGNMWAFARTPWNGRAVIADCDRYLVDDFFDFTAAFADRRLVVDFFFVVDLAAGVFFLRVFLTGP
jgi:hypothetical protein